MNSLLHPGVPCVISLPGGHMKEGDLILIRGEPLPHANRFSVSLLCGPRPDDANVALQLSPHFDTEWIIRNTKWKKQWGEEEGLSPRKFPLRRKETFAIEIFTSPTAFLIAIDGSHFCEFLHRVSYAEVDTLQVQGDVRLAAIEFKHSPTYPPQPNVNRLNVVNPPLPFASLINGPLPVGSEIQVHGRVHPQPNRFHVNLQAGCQMHPHPNIAFHFNPRFDGGNRVIVMNTWFGKWGAEQRIFGRSNPFVPNGHFVLSIRRQAAYFEVFVNGSRVATFNHRMVADIVTAVAIEGDVFVERVIAL